MFEESRAVEKKGKMEKYRYIGRGIREHTDIISKTVRGIRMVSPLLITAVEEGANQ